MGWTPMPEESSAYWTRIARERKEAVEQAIASGKTPDSKQIPRLAGIYDEKRAEEVKALQEQKAAQVSNPPAFAAQMPLPPQDPITLAHKQKAINGE